MKQYLAVFTIFTRSGMGVHNMDFTSPSRPTLEDVRALEGVIRERTGASTAVLTNIIELGGE
jgi:hypothetical protein